MSQGVPAPRQRGARPVCSLEGTSMPGAPELRAPPSEMQDVSVRALFIPKPFSVLRASQLGPGPGSHFQSWYFFPPSFCWTRRSGKNQCCFGPHSASFELIFLPLAGSAMRVQAMNAGHGRVRILGSDCPTGSSEGKTHATQGSLTLTTHEGLL